MRQRLRTSLWGCSIRDCSETLGLTEVKEVDPHIAQQRANFQTCRIVLDQLPPRLRRHAPRPRHTKLDDLNYRAYFRKPPLLRCCRRLVHGVRLRTLPALTAHLVGVPSVATHHLKAFVCNVLRYPCDEIVRAEHLKVALIENMVPYGSVMTVGFRENYGCSTAGFFAL